MLPKKLCPILHHLFIPGKDVEPQALQKNNRGPMHWAYQSRLDFEQTEMIKVAQKH